MVDGRKEAELEYFTHFMSRAHDARRADPGADMTNALDAMNIILVATDWPLMRQRALAAIDELSKPFAQPRDAAGNTPAPPPW